MYIVHNQRPLCLLTGLYWCIFVNVPAGSSVCAFLEFSLVNSWGDCPLNMMLCARTWPVLACLQGGGNPRWTFQCYISSGRTRFLDYNFSNSFKNVTEIIILSKFSHFPWSKFNWNSRLCFHNFWAPMS